MTTGKEGENRGAGFSGVFSGYRFTSRLFFCDVSILPRNRNKLSVELDPRVFTIYVLCIRELLCGEEGCSVFFLGETSNREFVIDCSCLAREREILSILLGGWILLGLVELDGSESRRKM